jgi:hypothetical protein
MIRYIARTLVVAFVHFSCELLSTILNADYCLYRKDAEDSGVLGVLLT